mgnify:CR=1 FL=1
MKITVWFVLSTSLIVGCGDTDSHYNLGYDDGYAEGYNTECKVRATAVTGDWDNQDYSRGYQEGRARGVEECRAE